MTKVSLWILYESFIIPTDSIFSLSTATGYLNTSDTSQEGYLNTSDTGQEGYLNTSDTSQEGYLNTSDTSQDTLAEGEISHLYSL